MANKIRGLIVAVLMCCVLYRWFAGAREADLIQKKMLLVSCPLVAMDTTAPGHKRGQTNHMCEATAPVPVTHAMHEQHGTLSQCVTRVSRGNLSNEEFRYYGRNSLVGLNYLGRYKMR
jgi:hypothetical protein